jgi:hypothetical protein
MRRPMVVLFGMALIAAVSSASAAGLTLKKPRTHVASVQAECVRWVEQNWSWYNYCGPVRYPPRFRYNSWAW